MTDDMDIFEMVVAYYCDKKWKDCKKYLDAKGNFRHPIQGEQFKMGHENDLSGAFIVANGSSLPKKLLEDDLVTDREVLKGTFVYGIDSFMQVMEEWRTEDGAIVYDSIDNMLMLAGILNKDSKKLAGSSYKVRDVLPLDFICEDRSFPVIKRGSKTDMAIKVSMTYPEQVDAVVLKEGAYTKLGMGPVVRFRDGKLIEMFYMKMAPESDEPFIDDVRAPGIFGWLYSAARNLFQKKQKAVGVYRRYVDDIGNVCRNKKGEIIPYIECIVDKSFRDKYGLYVRNECKIKPFKTPAGYGAESVSAAAAN